MWTLSLFTTNFYLIWYAFHNLYSNQITESEVIIMYELIILCLVQSFAAYFCLKASKQSLEVTPVDSFEDYFTFKINKRII